ncbi:MAG: undecaprenyl/decaprenyl-phosphate alpha-N-acetylglucosaminyl 1-phosphate transferase, partial [Acetobacteraceae bacterium]
LYQVAQRAGLAAPAVAIVHWGFAIFGGLCCLLFLDVPSPAKPFIPLLTLGPQFAWAAYVTARARSAGVVRW